MTQTYAGFRYQEDTALYFLHVWREPTAYRVRAMVVPGNTPKAQIHLRTHPAAMLHAMGHATYELLPAYLTRIDAVLGRSGTPFADLPYAPDGPWHLTPAAHSASAERRLAPDDLTTLVARLSDALPRFDVRVE